MSEEGEKKEKKKKTKKKKKHFWLDGLPDGRRRKGIGTTVG